MQQLIYILFAFENLQIDTKFFSYYDCLVMMILLGNAMYHSQNFENSAVRRLMRLHFTSHEVLRFKRSLFLLRNFYTFKAVLNLVFKPVPFYIL